MKTLSSTVYRLTSIKRNRFARQSQRFLLCYSGYRTRPEQRCHQIETSRQSTHPARPGDPETPFASGRASDPPCSMGGTICANLRAGSGPQGASPVPPLQPRAGQGNLAAFQGSPLQAGAGKHPRLDLGKKP